MTAHGAIAQLGERCNRTAEVVSSNLIGSTKFPKENKGLKTPLPEAGNASYHIATNGHAVKIETALGFWLSRCGSENTLRANRKEIEAFAGP